MTTGFLPEAVVPVAGDIVLTAGLGSPTIVDPIFTVEATEPIVPPGMGLFIGLGG